MYDMVLREQADSSSIENCSCPIIRVKLIKITCFSLRCASSYDTGQISAPISIFPVTLIIEAIRLHSAAG